VSYLPNRRERAAKALSDEEIARFLRRLAVTYRDKRTGNPLLAEALLRVADRLSRGEVEMQPRGHETPIEDQTELTLDRSLPLQKFNAADVTRFVQDASKTKSQLAELGALRFGLPRSMLLGRPIDLVRQALMSALQHEEALAVIGEEASRYGARRRS
jgi:hypothetical protein